MKTLFIGAAVCLAVGLAVTYATVSGQYSVNIHFVPPLVTGACNVAQFWNPPNVTCALCFCMTGSLSRCIPRPGCSPANGTSNSTTTPSPNTTLPTGSQEANQKPTTEQSHVTNKPNTTDPNSTNPTTQQGAEETTIMPPTPPHTLNLVRRRRRMVN